MNTLIKRRVFVALPIGHKLQKEILKWEKNWQNLPVRWLAGKNLHITLMPPWHEEDVDRIAELLGGLEGKFEPFELHFQRATFGPDPHRPRLIWAEGETPPQLVELKSAIERQLGIRPERRPFRLHLTLARFREENFPSFPIQQLNETVGWRDEVRSFVLMESHLSREGADYETIREFRI